MTSPILVAFKPLADCLRHDQLFHGTSYTHIGEASHWLEPSRFLARFGLENNIAFHTDDMVDLKDAAVFIFGEAPASRQEVALLRRDFPHLKLILQIEETPIGREWLFDPSNHRDFNAIVSYNPALSDENRYFSHRIPAGGIETLDIRAGVRWDQRKIACMVANWPNVKPLLPRRSGIGMIRRGWKFTPRTWWNYITEGGSLYGERLCIARQCNDTLGDQFDIFGPGWPIGEKSRKGAQGFSSARGPYTGSKLDLLENYRFTIAYENCLNDCGYITEKLFDALLAGCVPVYLGNTGIGSYVPKGVFVDRSNFETNEELLEHLLGMSETQWQSMREAGAAYLRGEAIALFGVSQYARSMIAAIQSVLLDGSGGTKL